MTVTTTTAVDNYDWLQAIDDHPKTTNEHLLAGYHHLGAKTDLTAEQLDESTFRLHMLGFLWPIDISDDGRLSQHAKIGKNT